MEDMDIPENRSEEIKPAFEMAVGSVLSVPGGSDIDYICGPLNRKQKAVKEKLQDEEHSFSLNEADFCCIVNHMSEMKNIILYPFLYC